MRKGSDLNGTFDREAPTMQLDPLNLVERIGCHVALTAVRTVNDRDLLDQQKVFSLAIGPGDLSNPCPFLAAVITCHLFTSA